MTGSAPTLRSAASESVSLTRWVRNQHGPFDKYGDGTIAVCRRCWTTWPCDEWVKAADDLKELEDQ